MITTVNSEKQKAAKRLGNTQKSNRLSWAREQVKPISIVSLPQGGSLWEPGIVLLAVAQTQQGG